MKFATTPNRELNTGGDGVGGRETGGERAARVAHAETVGRAGLHVLLLIRS